MLKGKIAVVTGGTRGIGYAIVRKFLQNNAQVVLFGLKKETVKKALEKLTKENIWVKRPGTGEIPAAEYESLLGRTANRNIPTDIHLSMDMID